MNTEQAINSFLENEERRAFRIAQISTGSVDEALDIIQDAMIKFVEKYSHKPESEWKPLFYRIVNSRITDWYRRRKVKAGVLYFTGVDASLEPGVSRVPGPERQLHTDSAIERLEFALRMLPLRQQQAVMHRLWDGMDTRDTAIAMGISMGSVKTHYSRALKALQEQLGDHWP